MADMIRKLGFVPISEFIEERLGLKVDVQDIFINCKVDLPKISTKKYLSNSEILARALETCEEGNQLCNGYSKTTKKWFSTNTSRNLLKSHKWAAIFEAIGCGYSIFILSKCSVIEKVENCFFFVCGDFGEYIEKKLSNSTIERFKLLYGREEIPNICLEDAMADIFEDTQQIDKIQVLLTRTFSKLNKMPLKSIFKSFFYENIAKYDNFEKDRASDANSQGSTNKKIKSRPRILKNSMNGVSSIEVADDIMKCQISPEKIVDFLFMLSKKFLRPVFGLNDFKILKGKITLILKRNTFESVSHEELLRHLRTSKLKLFHGLKGLSILTKTKILRNFLAYLFNNVYLKILRFFFYSTVTSHCRTKLYYFPRIEWNKKVNLFLASHLKKFDTARSSNVFATLRCIPKENGFRVLSNCSNYSSHLQKICSKPRIAKNAKPDQNCKWDNKLLDPQKKHDCRLHFDKIQEIYNDLDPILQISHANFLAELNQNHTKNNNFCFPADQCIETEKINTGPPGICNNTSKSNKGEDRRSEAGKVFKNGFLSINSTVLPFHSIIRKEMVGKLGFSLLSHKNVKNKLFSYLKSRKERLYMVKIDLKKCFDNISKQVLVQIIDNLLAKDEYYFREFILLKEGDVGNKIDMKYVRGSPDLLFPLNMVDCSNAQEALGCEIDGDCIIKENKTKIFSRSEILIKLKNMIENTPVFFQNSYYKRKKGIPQGCTISSILCALYYGYFDKKFSHLNVFISRYVDDFLVISENIEPIIEFFKISDSLSDFGFTINYSKVAANFNIEDVIFKKAENTPQHLHSKINFTSKSIDWCGLKIYDQGVNVKKSSSCEHFRYLCYLSNSNPGRKLFYKIKKAMSSRSHSVFLDKLNSKNGENIFDIFYFLGRKIRVELLRASFINNDFIRKMLKWCVNEVKTIVKTRNIHFDAEKID